MTIRPLSAVSPVDDSRFRQFVASVTDYAIYMLSPEGIVSSWNAGAQHCISSLCRATRWA